MTSSIKQVKISTSILWLLNKAETRNVFFSSADIYSDKNKLCLHSLIIRGLVCGELYCAAMNKLFPHSAGSIKTKDFNSIMDLIIELDARQLQEVQILKQKNREKYVSMLIIQNPFELSEHLQLIDAMMAVYLNESQSVSTIPNILGKLCEFRPNITEPKRLLEIWFKCLTCLSLTQKNIKDLKSYLKSIVIDSVNISSDDHKYVENIKLSDKIALILSFCADYIPLNENFLFEFSQDGCSSRENVKHNFMTVLLVFRRKFSKLLEDFKELMLVLNSSHIQITSNLLINIDSFIFEFFQAIEDYCNYGNKTYRMSPNADLKDATNMNKSDRFPNDKKGSYYSQTLNKLTYGQSSPYSKTNVLGIYSNKKPYSTTQWKSDNSETKPEWVSNLFKDNTPVSRKQSTSSTSEMVQNSRMVISEFTMADGLEKRKFLEKKNSLDVLNDLSPADGQTTWLLQTEKSVTPKLVDQKFSDEEETENRPRANETRLRLNIKRQEIERNRKKLEEIKARERQLLSEKVFKDVALGINQNDNEETIGRRPRKVSDVKRRGRQSKKGDLTRSRSQDVSRKTMDDITASIDELKSEILKLTSEQARLSAKISDKSDITDQCSPRTDTNAYEQNSECDPKFSDKSSIRSMPQSWHPHIRPNYDDASYNQVRIGYPYPTYHYPYVERTPIQILPTFEYVISNSYAYAPDNPNNRIIFQESKAPNSKPFPKSVQDSLSSRAESPTAISEPSKYHLRLSQGNLVNKTEPLTVQNVKKHNESMEKIYHSNSNIMLIDDKSVTVPDILPGDKIENEIESKHSTEVSLPDNNVNSSNIGKVEEINMSNSTNNVNVNSKKYDNEEIKGNNENNKFGFFISFDNDNGSQNKKVPKKLSLTQRKMANNDKSENRGIQDNNKPEEKAIQNNDKSKVKAVQKNEKVHNTEQSEIAIENMESVKIEKPVSFVVAVDESTNCVKVDDADVKSKLALLSEKREQIRKEKLESIKAMNKADAEKRQQMDLKKEQEKMEKKIKREAIYEAYMKRKDEKEDTENYTKKESKITKRLMRFASTAPPFQRKDSYPENTDDPTNSLGQSPIDVLSPMTKSEKNFTSNANLKLFVEPKIKSNKGVILNSLKHCCLAGKVNEQVKFQTIEELEKTEFSHCAVLMRSGCQYRGLYGFDSDSECLIKISGSGPKKITNKMVDKYFKYNSGSKKFIEITSTNHLSTIVDGITMFNTLWKSGYSIIGQLASSETSSQADHSSL